MQQFLKLKTFSECFFPDSENEITKDIDEYKTWQKVGMFFNMEQKPESF